MHLSLRPVLAILIVAGLLLPSCRTQDFRTEGDALRARVAELERDLANLDRRNAELRAELRRQRRTDDLPDDVAEHMPQPVELVLARFSHVRDRSGDGVPDELRVYLQPRDGRGRFVQVAGELAIDAQMVPPSPEIAPVPVGRITLGPAELRDTYRAGFMGTHYTIRMPVSIPPDASELSPAELGQVLVRARLMDARSGETLTAERIVTMR